MDLVSFTSAFEAVKAAREIYSGLKSMNLESENLLKINDGAKKIDEAYESLFQVREELLRSQEEIARLRNELDVRQDWKEIVSNYELPDTPGGAKGYRSKEGLSHFICPNCYANKQSQILQDSGSSHGYIKCPSCKESFRVRQGQKIKSGLGRHW